MNHSFDIEHAKKYGVPQAIILNNVLFWLAHNKAFNINIHDGKPWTFNSVAAYARLFPYWTQDKIRRYFESLEEEGVLISGNFNKKKYDKTKWHTVADQSLIPVTPDPLANSPKAKMPDGNGESAKPIPDINTDENISMLPKLKESKTSKRKELSKESIDLAKPIYKILEESCYKVERSKTLTQKIAKAVRLLGAETVRKGTLARIEYMRKAGKDLYFHSFIADDEAVTWQASKYKDPSSGWNSPQMRDESPADLSELQKTLAVL